MVSGRLTVSLRRKGQRHDGTLTGNSTRPGRPCGRINKGATRMLLEATAGQGSAVGHRFEHLSYIIEGVKKRIPIGVCIDTCHIFAAGYDLRTPEAFDATIDEFGRVVGFEHLYAFHVNDSAKALGTRVDRHRSLGDGGDRVALLSEVDDTPADKRCDKVSGDP